MPPHEIGTRLKRRSPKGDEYDRVVVRGHFEGGHRGEIVELVVSPATFGTPVCTTSESLFEAFTLDAGDDPAEEVAEIEARLSKLDTAPEWETSPEEVSNG